jgi:hypothetical protein
MNNEIMVVLTNYKRPQNLPKIIDAFRQQTRKVDHLVVVDNSPKKAPVEEQVMGGTHPDAQVKWETRDYPEAYPNGLFNSVDDVWRFTTNLGCPCHYAPALCHFEYKYCLFYDDDVLPGRMAVDYILREAAILGDKFSTIGQRGRNFKLHNNPGHRYVYGDVPQPKDSPVKCNLNISGHLVRTDLLYYILRFRTELIKAFGDEAKKLCGIHDDMLTCLGLQLYTYFPSYITSIGTDWETKLMKESLSQANSDGSPPIHRRPEHLAERNRFVDMAIQLGWSPR